MGMQSIATLTLTFTPVGSVSRGRAVGFDGAQATVQGQKILGVSPRQADSGIDSDVHVSGTAVIESGGIFEAGDSLIVDAEGRAIASTGNLGIVDGSTAVTSAAANGDLVFSGADLPEFVFADALEPSIAVGRYVEVLLRR